MQYIWNEMLPDDPSLWLDYEATEAALQINRERIQERMPLKARFYTTSTKERSKIKRFSLSPVGKLQGEVNVGELFIFNHDIAFFYGITINGQ